MPELSWPTLLYPAKPDDPVKSKGLLNDDIVSFVVVKVGRRGGEVLRVLKPGEVGRLVALPHPPDTESLYTFRCHLVQSVWLRGGPL